MFYRISENFHVIKGSREKISRSKIFTVWAFHENLTRGENVEEYGLVHSWLPRLSRNLGAATGAVTCTMMAGVLANFDPNSQDYTARMAQVSH